MYSTLYYNRVRFITVCHIVYIIIYCTVHEIERLTFVQVILDPGRVTFGNIVDWSCDEVDLGPEPTEVEMGEDDDGMYVIWL